MDYFNGITTEDFVEYFLKDLNCLEELTQYIYPNEMVEDTSVIADHINRCQAILEKYIINVLNDTDEILPNDHIKYLLDEKKKELRPILSPLMYAFEENVKVNYINLWDRD